MHGDAGGARVAAAVVVALICATALATHGRLRGDESRMSQPIAQDGGDAPVVARAAGPIQLGAERIDVPLKAIDDGVSLAKRLDSVRAASKVVLALRDISADEAPGTQFRIYLELPAGRTPTEADAHEISRLAFFNEVRAGREDAPTSSRTYDITSTLTTLQALGAIGDPVTVSFVPQRPPAPNAKAVVGRIELLVR